MVLRTPRLPLFHFQVNTRRNSVRSWTYRSTPCIFLSYICINMCHVCVWIVFINSPSSMIRMFQCVSVSVYASLNLFSSLSLSPLPTQRIVRIKIGISQQTVYGVEWQSESVEEMHLPCLLFWEYLVHPLVWLPGCWSTKFDQHLIKPNISTTFYLSYNRKKERFWTLEKKSIL